MLKNDSCCFCQFLLLSPGLNTRPPDQNCHDPFMQCVSCSFQLHVIHESDILHCYLTSAKQEKAFIRPHSFFMNPHGPWWSMFLFFLCTHKSLFIFFPQVMNSVLCPFLQITLDLISFRSLLALFPFSILFQVCGAYPTCKSSGYLSVFFGPQTWVLEGSSLLADYCLTLSQIMESERSWKTYSLSHLLL